MSIENTPAPEDISPAWRELLEYTQRFEKRIAQIHACPDGNE